MVRKFWTTKEDKFVIEHYGRLNPQAMQDALGRSWTGIKLRARKLKCHFYDKNRSHPYVSANLRVLLDENSLAYYWMGFLTADGHFDERRLILSLSYKDKTHIQKFSEFISCPNICERGSYVYVSVQDSLVVPQIKTKFGLTHRKTYCPPQNLYFNCDDFFVAFLIGFIDGDGHIQKQHKRNDTMIAIKLHKSWYPILELVSQKIAGIADVRYVAPRIRNSGYVQWNISNSKTVKFLKTKAQELRLPVLSRKWDLVCL